MDDRVVVFDLETVPDLAGVARVYGLDPADADAARAKLGKGFPKLIFHSIVCIGALEAERVNGVWRVRALDAKVRGEGGESALIARFSARLADLQPRLVSYNGSSFDLPVLRYRALINRVPAAGLSCRPYHRRYGTDAVDLCDVLGNYEARTKIGLDPLCRMLGLTGKTEGLDGSKVDQMVRDGRLDAVAAYCRDDVIATYRVWLAHTLVQGDLTPDGYQASEDDLASWLAA